MTYDDDVLMRLWHTYAEPDRERALAPLADHPRIAVSALRVTATRYGRGDETVLHLLNYAYDEKTDTVTPAESFEVRVPWDDVPADASLATLDGESSLVATVDGGTLVVEIPRLDLYGLLLLRPRVA